MHGNTNEAPIFRALIRAGEDSGYLDLAATEVEQIENEIASLCWGSDSSDIRITVKRISDSALVWEGRFSLRVYKHGILVSLEGSPIRNPD